LAAAAIAASAMTIAHGARGALVSRVDKPAPQLEEDGGDV
jgi:hypothetical protein